ncbi:MAG: TonB family protein [Candidatus Schmidhempelia sp.]|nr:TonB family protein [Candidatus Schmidhempelia sp.]
MDAIVKKKVNNANLISGVKYSIICHLLIAAWFIYGHFKSNTYLINEGNDAIKAVMIDLSQVAAPKLSMTEQADSSPEISLDVDDKQIELAVQQQVMPKDSTPTRQDSLEPNITKKQVIQLKPEKATHPKTRKLAKSAQRSIKQDVSANNVSDKVVASKLAAGTQYSSTPSAISRRQPDYPRRARDMKIEGRVVVLYDIDHRGYVVNIRIIEAKPNNIFNHSVRRAMGLWRYEPRSAKDLKITIVFNRDRSVSINKT